MFIQLFTFEAGRFMSHTNGLERNRRKHAPVLGCPYLLSEPLRVLKVTSQTRLQSLYTLLTNETPEFQRPETPPKRNAPIAQILDLVVHCALQIAWICTHDSH